jgi:hypothetical protein
VADPTGDLAATHVLLDEAQRLIDAAATAGDLDEALRLQDLLDEVREYHAAQVLAPDSGRHAALDEGFRAMGYHDERGSNW